ncbi:MAG TPA: DNA-directed RNA polymerase subunit K [Candidatus Nanoarchaeia archaeon]|nr:DNA-directed RNA polymerase subunit K [Candidatus Nanoarchaeia archaeon]
MMTTTTTVSAMIMMTKMEEYTKYEMARIIGARALQISMGAPFHIKLNDEDLQKLSYNPVEIAKLEFAKGLIPIEIRRPMPDISHKDIVPKNFDQTKLE